MTREQKLIYMQHFKSMFDKHRKSAVDPAVYIQKLPAKAVDLLKDYPALYNGWYRDESPCLSRLDVKIIGQFDLTYGCRGGHGGSASHSSTSIVEATPTLQLTGNCQLQQLATMFMNGMQALQAQQHQMMSSMMGGGGMDINDVADASRRQPRRLSSVAFGSQDAFARPAMQLALQVPAM
jgi:hypothetical protein